MASTFLSPRRSLNFSTSVYSIFSRNGKDKIRHFGESGGDGECPLLSPPVVHIGLLTPLLQKALMVSEYFSIRGKKFKSINTIVNHPDEQ
jgi:hypothetical protein